MTHDQELEYAALSAVAALSDSGRWEGTAPKWEIPAEIPSQRLMGMKRRGLLDSRHGYWWLTTQGCARLDALRALAAFCGITRDANV